MYSAVGRSDSIRRQACKIDTSLGTPGSGYASPVASAALGAGRRDRGPRPATPHASQPCNSAPCGPRCSENDAYCVEAFIVPSPESRMPSPAVSAVGRPSAPASAGRAAIPRLPVLGGQLGCLSFSFASFLECRLTACGVPDETCHNGRRDHSIRLHLVRLVA